MSATGALTTQMYVSPVRPTTRNQAGYEALDSRTVDPPRLSGELDTSEMWLLAADAVAGATSIEVDQDTTNFDLVANVADGATFRLAGDDTLYTVLSHDAITTPGTTAATLNIFPALAADAADNTALTTYDADSSFILTDADFAALFTGDEVTINAALAPLGPGITYYLIKGTAANKVQVAASAEQARSGDNITITGAFGTQTLGVSNWKLLGEITSIDEFGREYEVVTANNLADGATRKAKGSFNNGSVPFEALYDSRDPGAQVMEQALRSTETYAIQIDLPPDGDGNDGETFYFQALVTMFRPRIGGPNDMIMSRGNLEIDHNEPVRVAA